MSGGGAKPGERRGGRRKGTPNKTTAQLKDMILKALDDAGGVRYLKKQADESPAAFMSLLGRVLPTTLTGPGEGPIEHRHAASDEIAAIFGVAADKARKA